MTACHNGTSWGHLLLAPAPSSVSAATHTFPISGNNSPTDNVLGKASLKKMGKTSCLKKRLLLCWLFSSSSQRASWAELFHLCEMLVIASDAWAMGWVGICNNSNTILVPVFQESVKQAARAGHLLYVIPNSSVALEGGYCYSASWIKNQSLVKVKWLCPGPQNLQLASSDFIPRLRPSNYLIHSFKNSLLLSTYCVPPIVLSSGGAIGTTVDEVCVL